MQVENDNVLDFLFVNAGIPLSPSGGFDITYKLASLLKDLGFNVGILFIRDIFRNLYRIYPDRQLRYYLENHLSYSVFSNIVNRKSGLIPLKLLRKLLGINYEENLKGLRIFFSNGMQPTESKRIIANGWHNALIINEWDVTARKFILAQQDDADARWNPLLSHLALRAFSSGIPIISTNRIVTRKYYTDVIGQIPLAIDNNIFNCRIPIEKRDHWNVLIPLRQQTYKGAKLGLQILNLIHNNNPEISIHSFGNIPKSTIPSYLHHHGVVSKEVLSNLYNHASVFILPSLIEGYGLTALEAMACGAALVTTDNEGIREFVQNEKNGLVSRDFEPVEIKDLVIRLINDDKYRFKIASEGITTASRYTWDSIIDPFLGLIL